jgi:hypothetical protein
MRSSPRGDTSLEYGLPLSPGIIGVAAPKRLASGVLQVSRGPNNMRTLTALIIAVLYIFTAVRAKTFLDETVCNIQFVKSGCSLISLMGVSR